MFNWSDFFVISIENWYWLQHERLKPCQIFPTNSKPSAEYLGNCRRSKRSFADEPVGVPVPAGVRALVEYTKSSSNEDHKIHYEDLIHLQTGVIGKEFGCEIEFNSEMFDLI